MTKNTENRLKAIQRRLGIKPDGLLGPVTLTAIEGLLGDQPEQADAEQQYSLICSKRGLDQIVSFEISSAAYYRKSLRHPAWPGGESGVTIGIGYDLGFHSQSQINRDWKGKIADVDLEQLKGVAGLKAKKAKAVLHTLSAIEIPLSAASQVHYQATLPVYAEKTKKAYPGVELLPADAQSMLLSLVFNRGTRMSGSSRREMKAIQPLVVTKDLDGIAKEIRAMKRLWSIDKLPGLHKRRDAEANMIANAGHVYDPDEQVRV